MVLEELYIKPKNLKSVMVKFDRKNKKEYVTSILVYGSRQNMKEAMIGCEIDELHELNETYSVGIISYKGVYANVHLFNECGNEKLEDKICVKLCGVEREHGLRFYSINANKGENE